MPRYVLGLDLGDSSLGWAAIALNDDGCPAEILRTGVRIFEKGVIDAPGGATESRNTDRRLARQRRRQTARRAQRITKLFRQLQADGFLPEGEREALLDQAHERALHAGALAGHWTRDSGAVRLPYLLRARGLDHPLSREEFALALFHLGQRRGFLSNRKAPDPEEKPAEDADVEIIRKPKATKAPKKKGLKDKIADLAQAIPESGTRTLGEHLSRLDPREERIRARYTSRKMYLDEFERLWAAQAPHHALTDKQKKAYHSAIFFQRPLRSVKHLIGPCSLEPDRRRAPVGLRISQRFRMLQMLNNLEVERGRLPARRLTEDERQALIRDLTLKGGMTWKEVRKALGWDTQDRINLQRMGEDKLIGDRTTARLVHIFKDRWDAFAEEQKDAIIDDLRSFSNEEALQRRAMRVWGVSADEAARLAAIDVDGGYYLSLSRQAVRRLLPHLEAGKQYREAVDIEYPDAFKPVAVEKRLRPAAQALPALRNPLVARALTELRHVVNALIDAYGKPDVIRIELARDLKKTSDERQKIQKDQQGREKRRKDAADWLVKNGFGPPNGRAIEKYLLWKECGEQCPYTGQMISANDLFGAAPRFDIEHILPFSRSLDDSYLNKTLCEVHENREHKRNKTPMEAYAGDPDRYAQILHRIERMSDEHDLPEAKIRRFRLTPEETEAQFQGFSERALNDTRYASRLAREYLAGLYGGLIAKDETVRIQVGRGQITAHLRKTWGLNGILGQNGVKTRDDHRHHAVDAVCIALTSVQTVKDLSIAASRATAAHRHQFADMAPPWLGFADQVRDHIDRIVVSHRTRARVNGGFHDETHYSPPKKGPGGTDVHHVRKPLVSLTAKNIEEIVDPVVRAAVREALDGGDPKKVFADDSHLPVLKGANGTEQVVRRARIRVSAKALRLGARGMRFVSLRDNHHVEFVEYHGKKGLTWAEVVVNRFEALQRKARKQPIYQRDHGPGKRYLFSLAIGDVVALTRDGVEERWLTRCLSAGNYEFVQLTEARMKKDLKVETKRSNRGETDGPPPILNPRSANALREMKCRKIVLDALGDERGRA